MVACDVIGQRVQLTAGGQEAARIAWQRCHTVAWRGLIGSRFGDVGSGRVRRGKEGDERPQPSILTAAGGAFHKFNSQEGFDKAGGGSGRECGPMRCCFFVCFFLQDFVWKEPEKEATAAFYQNSP